MRHIILLCMALVLTGCVARSGAPGQIDAALPVITTVMPGQSLALRLEDGGTASVTAGRPYVSALGESCVRISGHASVSAACLRNDEWVGLPDIFPSRPNEGAMP